MTFADPEEPMEIEEDIVEEDETILNPQPIVHNSRAVDRQAQGSNSNAHFNQFAPKEQEEIEALSLRV